jgi:hypothetical protein
MSNDLSYGKPPKPYFQVARPAHYRFRTDLIEELCVADSMARLLPKTPEQYEAWLRICGLKPEKFPLARMQLLAARPYEMTPRYVFQAVALPGNSEHTNLVTDGNSWAVACEFGGLFWAVIHRAIELAVFLGVKPETAQEMFVAAAGPGPFTGRRQSKWAVGYERKTGLCTILAADHAGTILTFLDGRAGFYTPFTKPI